VQKGELGGQKSQSQSQQRGGNPLGEEGEARKESRAPGKFSRDSIDRKEKGTGDGMTLKGRSGKRIMAGGKGKLKNYAGILLNPEGKVFQKLYTW